jgi:hypothetical protein
MEHLIVASLVRHDHVPFGCATGCPPRPEGKPCGATAGPHVRPPSVDVLIKTRFPSPLSSHSV